MACCLQGLGVHTIPVPMELKTLVGPAPVGAPTGAKVRFFCLRRANKVMLRLGVAIDNSTIGMPIHGYRLTRHTATIRQGSSSLIAALSNTGITDV